MQALEITLTGEIQSSNFDDWKTDLLAQIKTISTSLSSDADFSAATKHVKQLKAAEKVLKEAKQSALDQADDIQKLFSAIDEVREEARQTRLTLEKQIKARKQEIKESVIASGIDTIKTFIAEQTTDFQSINHDDFLNEAQFAEALKGRSSLKTSEKAVGKLCEQIKQAITDKAEIVSKNSTSLAAMSAAEQALFQDREKLLAMESNALGELIDKRLAVFREGTGIQSSSKDSEASEQDADIEIDFDMEEIAEAGEDIAAFDIIISMKSTEVQANEFLDELTKRFSDESAVESVVIKKVG